MNEHDPISVGSRDMTSSTSLTVYGQVMICAVPWLASLGQKDIAPMRSMTVTIQWQVPCAERRWVCAVGEDSVLGA